MAIRIGCGSWGDSEYVGCLYDKELPKENRLAGYAEHFNIVEVNSSYYAVTKRERVQSWLQQTPASFIFNIKLHRHILSVSSGQAKKKPSPTKAGTVAAPDLLEYSLQQYQPLLEKKRLGAFLLLLSPSFSPAKRKLSDLDKLIDRIRPYRLAVELRHRDWVEGKQRESTLSFLRERQLIWVGVDMPLLSTAQVMPSLDEVTYPGLAYLRLHGRNPDYLEGKTAEQRHHYLYNEVSLQDVAQRVRKLSRRADEVHVIANNHSADFAPRTALALRKLLGVEEHLQ